MSVTMRFQSVWHHRQQRVLAGGFEPPDAYRGRLQSLKVGSAARTRTRDRMEAGRRISNEIALRKDQDTVDESQSGK